MPSPGVERGGRGDSSRLDSSRGDGGGARGNGKDIRSAEQEGGFLSCSIPTFRAQRTRSASRSGAAGVNKMVGALYTRSHGALILIKFRASIAAVWLNSELPHVDDQIVAAGQVILAKASRPKLWAAFSCAILGTLDVRLVDRDRCRCHPRRGYSGRLRDEEPRAVIGALLGVGSCPTSSDTTPASGYQRVGMRARDTNRSVSEGIV